jgi:hypothetical protein
MGNLPPVCGTVLTAGGFEPVPIGYYARCGSSLSASRSRRLDRFLQHELALLFPQGLCLVGQHREQPGELHLKPDVVLGDIHGPWSWSVQGGWHENRGDRPTIGS